MFCASALCVYSVPAVVTERRVLSGQQVGTIDRMRQRHALWGPVSMTTGRIGADLPERSFAPQVPTRCKAGYPDSAGVTGSADISRLPWALSPKIPQAHPLSCTWMVLPAANSWLQSAPASDVRNRWCVGRRSERGSRRKLTLCRPARWLDRASRGSLRARVRCAQLRPDALGVLRCGQPLREPDARPVCRAIRPLSRAPCKDMNLQTGRTTEMGY